MGTTVGCVMLSLGLLEFPHPRPSVFLSPMRVAQVSNFCVTIDRYPIYRSQYS